MFQGTSLLSLDAKGRLSMPARHRESLVLSCQGEVRNPMYSQEIGFIREQLGWNFARV